jgi:hypothetical protein
MYRRKLRIKGNYFLLLPELWSYFIFQHVIAHSHLDDILPRPLKPRLLNSWMVTSRFASFRLWSQSIAFSLDGEVKDEAYSSNVTLPEPPRESYQTVPCTYSYAGKNVKVLICVNIKAEPKIKHLLYDSPVTVLCAVLCYHTYSLKNAVLWDVTPCGSCKNRRLGRT